MIKKRMYGIRKAPEKTVKRHFSLGIWSNFSLSVAYLYQLKTKPLLMGNRKEISGRKNPCILIPFLLSVSETESLKGAIGCNSYFPLMFPLCSLALKRKKKCVLEN